MMWDPVTGIILAVLHIPIVVVLFVVRDRVRRRWPL